MKYKAIIIDDEKNARILLEGMIKEYSEDIEIVDSCVNLQTGVKSIYKNKPDLVFLDIEMPGQSGLELLDYFNEGRVDFSIIFTTAYNQYAIQAFKLSAIDYLLKPIEPDALELALTIFKRHESKQDFKLLKDNLKEQSVPKIALPTAASIKFVELDKIMFLKGDGGYTHFYLNDGSTVMVSKTLKVYEDILKEQKSFFRCHKSYIVNVNYISDYAKSDGGFLVIKNNHKIGVSSEKVDELLNLMGTLN
ncbi:MAG: response regulator transcription factor [Bacteroidia bacterium]|nr:response regulator transcription factor [Bacteroidia bacterium]